MSRRDIGRVLSPGHAERVCVTYVRRADGSLVTRTMLLLDQVLASFRRPFSYLLTTLVPIAIALCRTPQKKLLLGTWKVMERHGVESADRIIFKDDYSFVAFTPAGTGEDRAGVRGGWYADAKNVYMWREGKKYVWDIVELLPERLRLQNNAQVLVYQRVGQAAPRASNQIMRIPRAFGVAHRVSR